MSYRQLILLTCGILSVVIILNLPGNKNWLESRIKPFTESIYDEIDMMDYEDRRVYRLGSPYTGALAIKAYLDSIGGKNNLILIPPQPYLKAKNVAAVVPEPIIFYMYTGLQAAWISSKNVMKCNWGMVVDRGQLTLIKLDNPEKVKQLLHLYAHPEIK